MYKSISFITLKPHGLATANIELYFCNHIQPR